MTPKTTKRQCQLRFVSMYYPGDAEIICFVILLVFLSWLLFGRCRLWQHQQPAPAAPQIALVDIAVAGG